MIHKIKKALPFGFFPVMVVCCTAFLTGISCSPKGDEALMEKNPNAAGTNRYVTPVNQILTPAGIQVELPGMRPQVLALSPNGHILATAGKTHELVIVAPETGKIIQNIPLPSEKAVNAKEEAGSPPLEPDTKGQVSYTGLVFSADGSHIYLSNVNGSIKVFSVDAEDRVSGLYSIPLPPANAPRRRREIPAGLTLSEAENALFVVFNLSNRLAKIDLSTGQTVQTWDVGTAPYDVKLVGKKAYVSNWGGRRPDANSLTGPAGKGTVVRVGAVRYIA